MNTREVIKAIYDELIDIGAVQLTRFPSQAIGAALKASGNTTGVYLYAAAGANQVQIRTAAQNTLGYWVWGMGIDTPSASSIFVLWLGRGTIANAVLAAEREIAVVQVTAVGTYAIPEVEFPRPILVRAAVGVAMDLASNNAGADDTARGHIITSIPRAPV